VTDEEYNAANVEITRTFPTVGDWFDRLPTETKQAQRARRKAALIGLELRDVRGAISALSCGTESPWTAYGAIEWAYGTIASKAAEVAARRAMRSGGGIPVRGRYQPIGGLRTIREQADELAELKKREGWTHDDTKTWLDSEIPEDPEDRREWHKCTACQDSGLVPCLSWIRRTKEGRILFAQGSKACHCQQGRTFSERRDESTRITPYDECEHVKLPFGIISGEEAQALLLATRERRANRNRNPGFDAYNDEQAARQF
jgi:hypothetical protein